ncbi:MAG TPA: hypothetical protein VML55_16950 [Planctomycetaceae bacterium]|nr:hypothetical protein [Planctomycetaceae bacterium]
MRDAVIFMQWESYAGADGEPPFFASEPLTFNSRQERLHELAPGDRLWLVSRSPDDRQYYIVAVLSIAAVKRNDPASREGSMFGEFAVVADRAGSHDLGKRFSAEGLLRAFQFETGRPIRYGASIGQSLQTLRVLDETDGRVLDAALARILAGEERLLDAPFGLWTKCDREFADYFLKNWTERREPLAFLLYDSPPVLLPGAPVFIHSEKHLRLIARFRESQFIAGQKFTVDEAERLAERERIWQTWRAGTLDPPDKAAFDAFWQRQHGVRSLFVMDEVVAVPRPSQFKEYGRALEWGYPTGVGYRYLSLSQSYMLLKEASIFEQSHNLNLSRLLIQLPSC